MHSIDAETLYFKVHSYAHNAKKMNYKTLGTFFFPSLNLKLLLWFLKVNQHDYLSFCSNLVLNLLVKLGFVMWEGRLI